MAGAATAGPPRDRDPDPVRTAAAVMTYMGLATVDMLAQLVAAGALVAITLILWRRGRNSD